VKHRLDSGGTAVEDYRNAKCKSSYRPRGGFVHPLRITDRFGLKLSRNQLVNCATYLL